jgi:predicted Zn-dependent protease
MRRKLNRRLLLWTGACVLVVGILGHLVHGIQMSHNAERLLENADWAMAEYERLSKDGDQAESARHLEQALTFYHHYLTYKPDDTVVLAKYGLALDQHAGSAADRQRVVTTFEKVLRKEPGRKDVRLRLIHDLIHLQYFRDAVANIEALLPQADDKAELEHMLGWCLEASGDYAKAAAAFARSVAIDPRRLESYVLRAEVLKDRLDRPEDAEATMDDLVKANAQSYRAYLIRLRYRQQESNFAGAETDLKTALKLAPREPAVLLAAADWAQSKGDLDKARGLIRQARALEPRNAAVVKAQAGLEMRAGKRAEAVAVLEDALKDMAHADLAHAGVAHADELHLLLAELLVDEGKLTDAAGKIHDLSEAGIAPALLDYLRARVAVGKGQWHEALACLEKARADLGTKSEWAGRIHALLGQCYAHLGDHEQEVASFRRAVQQEPTWTLARFGLGAALVSSGRLDEALAELRLVQTAADAPPELWSVLARALLWKNLRLPEKQRNWAEVDDAIDQVAAKTPGAAEPSWLRAEVLAAQGEYGAARDLLEKTQAAHPEQVIYWAARADLAGRQNRWAEAALLLDEAERKLGDRVELRLARCRLWGKEGTGAARKGLESLAQNLDQFTPQVRARLLRELADTWARLGETARAEALWARIAQEQPRDLGSRFALFEAALGANQLDKARALLVDLRKLEGAERHLWRYGTAALLVQEAGADAHKLDAARKALADLGRREKSWARVPLLKARIDEIEGSPHKAVGNYLQAFELGDRQPQDLARLVHLLVFFTRYLDAEQVLAKVEEQTALPPELLRLGADVALANQNLKKALDLAARAVDVAAGDYRDFLWLGRIYHAAGAGPKAEEALRRAAALAPHAPGTWIALAEQLTRTGKRAAAQAALNEAKEKVSPRLALFTQARCYEVMGLVGEAETCYRRALDPGAEDFVFLAHAADFFRRTDQPDKAEPYLVALVKPGSGAPVEIALRARRHLAFVLAARGKADLARALALIDGNLSLRPNNAADLRARAFVEALTPSRRRQAIRVFEETAGRQPLSADEQLLLARLFDADDDQPRAREQVLALLTLQPENPQFLAFYVRQLAKAEELDQARAQLQKLEILEPNSPRTLEAKARLR